MYSHRRSKATEIPEAPIYPVIKKVAKKPVKTKPIEYVDVGDILSHTFDEAALSDFITPVNRGATLPAKKSYTPKVNKNFRPETKLLHTLERSIQNQPRGYTSVKVGNAGANENIGITQNKNTNKLLSGSGILKTPRTSYTPRDEFGVSVRSEFAGVLQLPSDNEVLPDLKETIPHPSVEVSSKFDWQARQKDPQIRLKKKYNETENTQVTTVPFSKPIDVGEVERARKYSENLRYKAPEKMNYTSKIHTAAEDLSLPSKYTPVNVDAPTQLPFEKNMSYQEINRVQESSLQPSHVASQVPYEKSMDYRNVELDEHTRLLPTDSVAHVPYHQKMPYVDVELEGKSNLQPTSAIQELPYQKSMEHSDVELHNKSLLQPTGSRQQVPYQKNMDVRQVHLDTPTIYTSRNAPQNIPFAKRTEQNPNIHLQERRSYTSTAPGHSGGYMTQNQIDNQYDKNAYEAKMWTQRQQARPNSEYSFDPSGSNRQGYFPAGNVPTQHMTPNGFSRPALI